MRHIVPIRSIVFASNTVQKLRCPSKQAFGFCMFKAVLLEMSGNEHLNTLPNTLLEEKQAHYYNLSTNI